MRSGVLFRERPASRVSAKWRLLPSGSGTPEQYPAFGDGAVQMRTKALCGLTFFVKKASKTASADAAKKASCRSPPRRW